MSRLEYQPSSEDDFDKLSTEQAEDAPQRHRRLEAESDTDNAAEEKEHPRLHYVDQILKNAPLLSAPLGFADRVMGAIRKRIENYPDYKDGTGLAIALTLSAIVILPLLALFLNLMYEILTNTEVRDSAIDTLGSAFNGIQDALQSPPLFITITLLGIILLAFMLLVRFVFRVIRGIFSASHTPDQTSNSKGTLSL